MTTRQDSTQEDVIFGDGENQEENKNVNLPPLASGNGVNVWFSQETDKNGDCYLVIDMPGHEPVRVFFSDAAKPTLNRFRDEWVEKRKESGGGS